MIARFALALLLLPLAAGCSGYRMGMRSLYAPQVRSVYVPVFESDSFRRNLGERLTEAVVKEIELRTPYKVVADASADSILTGRIVSDTKRVLVENSFDEPREIEVRLVAQVSWVDRRGALIHPDASVPVPTSLIQFGQSASVVPEAGRSIATGQQQSIERLAEQIVATMEAAW